MNSTPLWYRIVDRPVAAGVLIFLLSVAVRLSLVLLLELHQDPFRGELQKIAESLALTGTYGNPYALDTGPSAHNSPLFTLMAAAIFSIWGIGSEGELALYLLAISFASLLYGLLPSFARRFGLGTRTGVAAGLFGALVPFHFLNEIRAGDAPLAALLLMGILGSALSASRRLPSWVLSVVTGFLWGAGLLLMPSFLPFLMALAGLGLMFRRSRSFLQRLGVAVLVAGACLVPWALRNQAALGETVWFRSNFGLELRMSHNDRAAPDIDTNRVSGSFGYHPFVSERAALEVRRLGEIEFNRRLHREALSWIGDHPREAMKLTALRILYFWFPKTLKLPQSILLSMLTLGGIGGLFLLYRCRPEAALLLASLWVTFPAVYYLIQSAVRYRYPMNWTLLLLSAYAALRILDRLAPALVPRGSRGSISS